MNNDLVGAAPRLVRVHLHLSSNPRVLLGGYQSLGEADAVVTRAFAGYERTDRERNDTITVRLVWHDRYYADEFLRVASAHVVAAANVGQGLLRYLLVESAKAQASGTSGTDLAPFVVEQRRQRGRELLRRLVGETSHDEAQRNATVWYAPSLWPDPVVAIGNLRQRFAAKRSIARAVGEDESGELAAYPVTTHADVRYVVNHVSLALRTDLATLDPIARAVVWNYWRGVAELVKTLLRSGDDDHEYADNEGFWTRQLPDLARLLDDADEPGGPFRNGRLTFRPVGRRGEPYPPWITDLRGRSGAYVIRVPDENGDRVIVYVGSSSADRLYETVTRHFQIWRRWKGFWRGQYGEGHDPGLSYDRDVCDAAVIVTQPQHALELESRLIRRLRPRDNVIGQEEVSDVPF